MNNLVRIHPDISPQKEIRALLGRLPENMREYVAKIQEQIKALSPAGLEVFRGILAEKVNGVIRGENIFEQRVEMLLKGANNTEM